MRKSGIVIVVVAGLAGWALATRSSNQSVAPQPTAGLAGSDAMAACRELVREKASFPSTIDISVWGTDTIKGVDGVRVAMPFTARNHAGAELSYTAHCYVKNDRTATLEGIKRR